MVLAVLRNIMNVINFLLTFVPRMLKDWPEKMEKQEQFHQKGKLNGATLKSKHEGANFRRIILIWPR